MKDLFADLLHDLGPWLLMALWLGWAVLGVSLLRYPSPFWKIIGGVLLVSWSVTLTFGIWAVWKAIYPHD